jgi:hypothetical protein
MSGVGDSEESPGLGDREYERERECECEWCGLGLPMRGLGVLLGLLLVEVAGVVSEPLEFERERPG